MHIEITGVSGAGKSTIARNLTRELNEYAVPVAAPKLGRSEQVPTVRDRLRHILQALWYCLCHPLLSSKLLYYCIRWGMQRETGRWGFILQQFMVAVGIKVKQASSEPISITDHGTIAFMATKIDPTVVEEDTFYKRLLELVYPPDQPKVIVRVETEPQVVIKRKRERKRQGLQRGTSEITVPEVRQQYSNAAQVIDTIDNLHNATTTMVVDGVADQKANAAEIIAVAVELDKKLQDEENILPERVHREFG